MTVGSVEPLQAIRDRLLDHPIYKEVHSAERALVFMQYHVFAVWDFMSLLKRMQQLVTVTTLPWLPDKSPYFARFINEIVLGEESDEDGDGGYISHFELYVQAMEEVGADTAPVLGLIERLRAGQDIEQALMADDIPVFIRDFVSQTMQVVLEGKPHEVAAAFFYGREHIIPDMFSGLVKDFEQGKDGKTGRLVYYLERHIELDNDRHGPLAKQLLDALCAENEVKLAEAQRVAGECLESRIKLWDGIYKQLV